MQSQGENNQQKQIGRFCEFGELAVKNRGMRTFRDGGTQMLWGELKRSKEDRQEGEDHRLTKSTENEHG